MPLSGPGWHPHLWHPFTQVATADPPLRVVRGEGALLELDDGRRLIDAISSWWVTLHGHGEPSIAAAIAGQARRLEQVGFSDFRHPAAEQLAERLAACSGLERLFFSDNGSTAVEVALKIAWQWWRNRGEPRQQLIGFEGAYHGDTFGAMAVGERSLFSAPFEPLLFAVARAPWPATWWDDDGVEAREAAALERLEQLLETPTAAVILEPLLQGAGGMALVREGFLRRVEALVRASGALLIADEVMTGFGRSGHLFACQRAGIRPDLMALSKGLTGGFLPMGVTLAREAIYNGFIGTAAGLTLFHGHSFTANPLGCAAALASLDLLQERPERHQGFEARHRPHLEALARHRLVRRPRLLGSVAAFEVATDRPGYLNPVGPRLQRLALERGVFLRPLGQVVYLLPPLCLDDDQLADCYAVIGAALSSL
ncbi:adenosylmethionine--8-amino-7-oxononanoate transaminase [Synechococcus sp. CS-1332]|uniref:adenosylmethionine--8-amino-7-oxononanoate transaminase n=1 Tax=Synechococcus sp. CS-1332 TaxID=2847972 RepID=UPI00223C26AD|nr:adenosylmethionine--8-amino-7-oxononanoate transaminase [Synechococcus sp. CS-1332]MCT0206265.1 adenosylmethionine--8-amino-7-oxononanoate transaminase [Synechococcus sp. CS-1332]